MRGDSADWTIARSAETETIVRRFGSLKGAVGRSGDNCAEILVSLKGAAVPADSLQIGGVRGEIRRIVCRLRGRTIVANFGR